MFLHNMAAGRSWSGLGPTQTLPVETGRGSRVQVAGRCVECGGTGLVLVAGLPVS